MGVICLPVILLFAFLIFLYDRKNPFYVAPRVGENGKLFNMIKLRSMVADAHKYKMDSTANDDPRITPIGKWVRRFKVDELAQIINVIKGDMNWVGPRP
jgi:lipopolysaccharide/colanic/teichoic acid biosynthesis glycosyltransferase